MGSFSSFGPAIAGNGDLLKPDITAPGVDVVAAVAPPGNNNNSWDSYQGTSMSAPHITGIAALLKGKNPSWSPMWIKSALMTTASPKDSGGGTIKRGGAAATPLNFGNGHVRAANAFNPGLIYDSSPTEWLEYGCAIGQIQLISGLCPSVRTIDPSDFNNASIAVGDLVGAQTVTRRVTNVTQRAGVYEAVVEAPAGVTVKVTPNRLVIPPGRTASFTVTLTRTTAAVSNWAFGALTWKDKSGHEVRSAIAARPVAVAVSPEVTQSGASGSMTLPAKSGYTGTMTATAFGLNPSNVTTLSLVGTETGFDPNNPATNPAVGKVTLTIPAGTKVGRVATFDSDYPGANGLDVDLFAYQAGTTNLVGSSSGSTAEESIPLGPGTYDVYVVQFALPAGTGTMNLKHHAWAVGAAAAGNLTVTPASRQVTTGGDATLTVAWNGLTVGSRYLGVIEFGNGTATIARTIVAVAA
jgi:hypothetical protein